MTARSWFSAAAGSFVIVANAVAADPGSLQPTIRAEIVPTQPPSPRLEVLVADGSRGREWERTGGYWHWRTGGWVWLAPRWQLRPANTVRWVPPEYVRQDGRWRYVPGHWSSQRVLPPARDRARHAVYLSGSARARQ